MESNQDLVKQPLLPKVKKANKPSCFEQVVELSWYAVIIYAVKLYGWIWGLAGLIVFW